MKDRTRLIIFGALALLFVGGLTYVNHDTVFYREAPETPSTISTNETKDIVVGIPEGGRDIDEYAFVTDDYIYFRSVMSATSTIRIPNGDPATFARVSDFMTYPGTEVTAECSGPGRYAYYGDSKNIYFYQIWKTPDFTSSKIEIIAKAPKEQFALESSTMARAGDKLFSISPLFATSTCKFDINPI